MNSNKPIPSKKGVSQLYWESLKDEKLLIQSCNLCKKNIFYPRVICPHCGSGDLEYFEHPGTGRIYSYSIVYKNKHPAFKDEVPYIIALVDLQGDVRMMSRIVDGTPLDIEIGAKVKVQFDKIDNETTLPHFKLY